LRYGKRYPSRPTGGGPASGVDAGPRFEEPAAQAAFEHLLGAYFVRDSQLSAIDAQIEELAALPPLAEPVARLGALRGIATLSAVTITTETCDFRRFPTAGSYMAFGRTRSFRTLQRGFRHQGSITKTGNQHIRRVLVEAAWSYRYAPAVRDKLKKRQEGQPPEVVAYSWAAQCRLHATFASSPQEERQQGGRRRGP